MSRDETADQLDLLDPRSRALDVDTIFRRSKGLPLFVEQLAAHASEEQPLPGLLSDLLGQRVRHLSENEHAIVDVLAVADRALSGRLLGQVTNLSDDAAHRAVHRLDARRLLAATKPDVALRHPLLAEAVRDRLVGSEAIDLHRRLATALAASAGVDPGEVATHYRAAGDAEQELIWVVRTAEVARKRVALGQEAGHWLRALELWPDRDDLSVANGTSLRRIDVELAAMSALPESAQIEQAYEHLEGLLDRADRLPPVLRGEIYRRAAHICGVLEGQETGLSFAREAVTIL